MSISTCPIATVEAPVEQVWQLLADPYKYGLWWDAETPAALKFAEACSSLPISLSVFAVLRAAKLLLAPGDHPS